MSSCYAPSGRTESYFQAGAVAVFVFGIFVSVLGFVLGSFVFPEYVNSALQDRLCLWDLDSVGRQNFVRGYGNTACWDLEFQKHFPTSFSLPISGIAGHGDLRQNPPVRIRTLRRPKRDKSPGQVEESFSVM